MFLPVVMSCSNKGRTDETNGLLRSIGLIDAFVAILIYIIVHAGRLLSLGERRITKPPRKAAYEMVQDKNQTDPAPVEFQWIIQPLGTLALLNKELADLLM